MRSINRRHRHRHRQDRADGGQVGGQRVRAQHVLHPRPRRAEGVLVRRAVRDPQAEGREHRHRGGRVSLLFNEVLVQLYVDHSTICGS